MMKNTILLILAAFSFSVNAESETPSDNCAELWTPIEKATPSLSDSDMLERWKAISDPNCTKSGQYHYRLGWLYVLNGKYEKAESTFQKGLSNGGGYEKDLTLGLADIYVQRGIRTNKPEDLQKASIEYLKLIDKFPNFDGAYAQMGALKMMTGDMAGAVKYSEAAVKLQGSVYAYRNLVIAYQSFRQYEAAIDAFSKAVELDDKNFVLSDRDAMLSVSVAYAEVGKFELSKNALATLLKNKPSIENDEQFGGAIAYIKGLMAKAKN